MRARDDFLGKAGGRTSYDDNAFPFLALHRPEVLSAPVPSFSTVTAGQIVSPWVIEVQTSTPAGVVEVWAIGQLPIRSGQVMAATSSVEHWRARTNVSQPGTWSPPQTVVEAAASLSALGDGRRLSGRCGARRRHARRHVRGNRQHVLRRQVGDDELHQL